jgi:chemotaxis protein MotA
MAVGVVCIVITMIWGGANLGDYLDPASVFTVVGGVFAATIASYPMKTLKNLIKVISNAFRASNLNMGDDIEVIIKLSNIQRREGVLSLEEHANNMEDPFLKKGIMLIADGASQELVQSVMETDLAFMRERHASGQSVLLQMSAFSPAFGMIGTLIGLVNMLNKLEDMAALGPNMAIALVTTFYGVILANLVFTPLAKKLKIASDAEYLRKEILLEGMLSIMNGENPQLIREKLNSFLSNTEVKNGGSAAGE